MSASIAGLLMLLVADEAEDQDRLFRNAQIVRMMAGKGDRIFAGPLTVLVDPVSHQAVKEVKVDPSTNQLIPALYRHPGDRERTSVFLIRPMDGKSDKAVYRTIGEQTLMVIPDDLGNRDIRKRTFWTRGQRDGRKYVRQIGYYEIVAYSSRDAFVASTTSGTKSEDQISWCDETPEGLSAPTTVPLTGYAVTGVSTPGEKHQGEPYDVTVFIRSDGSKEKLLVKAVRNPGGDEQNEEADLYKQPPDAKFRFITKDPKREDIVVSTRKIEKPLPADSDPTAIPGSADPIGFQDADPTYAGSFEESVPRSTVTKGSNGRDYVRLGIAIGVGATALLIPPVKLLESGGKKAVVIQTHINDGDAAATENVYSKLSTRKPEKATEERRDAKETALRERTIVEARVISPEDVR